MTRRLRRILLSTVDVRPWLHLLRMVHFYNYSHVTPLRKASIARTAVLAPNVSLRNGANVRVDEHARIGERCSLWAGKANGIIEVGEHALFGPQVFVTAANYQTRAGTPVMNQPMDEAPVSIGKDVWLGARVVVLPGVTIGDGCVVGAGSVVTRSISAGSIAVGSPARVVRSRS